jgi:hypothetical protein
MRSARHGVLPAPEQGPAAASPDQPQARQQVNGRETIEERVMNRPNEQPMTPQVRRKRRSEHARKGDPGQSHPARGGVA